MMSFIIDVYLSTDNNNYDLCKHLAGVSKAGPQTNIRHELTI